MVVNLTAIERLMRRTEIKESKYDELPAENKLIDCSQYMFSRIVTTLHHHIITGSIKKVLICPDKFKFSLTSSEVSKAIQKALPVGVNSKILMLADGGEGSLETISNKVPGRWIHCEVDDPLFRRIQAEYYESDEKDAYIQMARASGLSLVSDSQRNPLKTSTIGTGQLVLDSLQRQNNSVYIFVGGSSTNDGGIGCAAALGYQFFDQSNQLLSPVGSSLQKIVSIKEPSQKILSLIKRAKIKVCTDVLSPLTGPYGASFVYGAQKGASLGDQQLLDKGLDNLNRLFKKYYGIDANSIPGSGAAGGLAAGCHIFLNAEVTRGIDLILKLSSFDKALEDADLVITGEGKFDDQTLSGKVVKGVIDRCLLKSKPVVVLSAIVEAQNLSWTEDQVKVVQVLSGEDRKVIDPEVTKRRLREAIQQIFRR